MKYLLLHREGGGLARSGHLLLQTASTPGKREVRSRPEALLTHCGRPWAAALELGWLTERLTEHRVGSVRRPMLGWITWLIDSQKIKQHLGAG